MCCLLLGVSAAGQQKALFPYLCCVQPPQYVSMNEGLADRIVSGAEEGHLCSICFEILNVPRQCRNGHIFCLECLRTALRYMGASIVTEHLVPAPPCNPPPQGGEPSLGPKTIENTGRRS